MEPTAVRRSLHCMVGLGGAGMALSPKRLDLDQRDMIPKGLERIMIRLAT